MKRPFSAIVLLALCSMGLNPAAAQNNGPAPAVTPPPAPKGVSHSPIAALRSQDVVDHLEEAISWYRHIEAWTASTSAASEVLLRDNMHKTSLRALQLAFDFARAQAARRVARAEEQAAATGQSAPGSESRNMEQAATRAADRVNGLESRITALDAAIPKAPARSRALLGAQRQELNAQLGLAREVQKTLQGVVSFIGSSNSSTGAESGLANQISDLARTVPEVRITGAPENASNKPVNPAPDAKSVTQPPPVQTSNQGLFGLIGEVYSIARARSQVRDLDAETTAVLGNIDRLRAPLVTAIREAVQRSDQLAKAAASDDVAQLAAAQKEIATLEVRFKQLSTVIVPLGEEQILVENVRGYLDDWRSGFTQQLNSTARSLLIRSASLAIAILLVLALSEIWRRATFRYIRDLRRRRQFLVVRRIIVSCAILLVFVLGFVTEFGSFATYAGFLTAGIAVALQNVILAVVAYFFLIGRWGVRVGERVTIAGVTGDVIELGLVRLYMMELTGTGDLQPTGRVVVFSNAVLFQPAAIFKQMPGANYAWHTVSLTLAPDTDFPLADRLVTDTVKNVYEKYRGVIEAQHASFERSVELQVKAPQPEMRLSFTDPGLTAFVRYPVDLKHASETDEQMLKALYDAISHNPSLHFATGGGPKLISGA